MRSWPVLLLVVAACSGGGDDDELGSQPLERSEPIEITSVPASYRITYEVVDGDREQRERLTVRRPFESRLETWEGADTDGRPATTEIASFGRIGRVTTDDQTLAVAVTPAVAPYDVRLDTIVDDAVRNGVFVRRGQREVAGRPCQVYRTGQTLRLVELTPPTDNAFVDVCVDAAGLVLEEVDGDRRRRAVEVEVALNGDELDDDQFDVGERTIPVLEGGGVVTELTADSRPPGEFLELGDDLPLDEVVGRYAVVPPQPEAFTDPTQRNRRVGTVADVLRDAGGTDIAVVERGGSLGGEDVTPDSEHATDVALGAVGPGRLLLTTAGPEVVAELGGGRFVRVSGTLDADTLVALARDLDSVEGGTLTTVAPPW